METRARRLTAAVLAALLVSPARGAGNVTNATPAPTLAPVNSLGIPLADPTLPQACRCKERLNEGYSETHGRCMKGVPTACSSCPNQQKCATISTVVGDGIRAFLGDCRVTPTGARSQCYVGPEASLAYPTSVAFDQEDNLYIADYGNNRIRKWDRLTDSVVTIAGTGEIGFSGDGGPARFARLRQPEGIAVKPGVAASSLEVYFSDFKNQRIRRLTLKSDVWYIDTVAGTGTMGDAGTACDTGCNATSEAILNNPRSLAFSSEQDLFIADSGNRKVRKLTPAGVFSTLVGTGGTAPHSSSLDGQATSTLPGHWKQPSVNLSLGTIYTLSIDNHDNLWFIDGPPFRFWKTPLYARKKVELSGDRGRLLEFYLKNFFPSPAQRLAAQQNASEALQTWTSVLPNTTVPTVSVVESEVGYSSWKYGHGTQGDWCPKSNKAECKPVPAQDVSLNGPMGMCFDAADNMYVSDSDASQILYLDREDESLIAARTIPPPNRMTTRNCDCRKYWFDILRYGGKIPMSIRNQGDSVASELCQENPLTQNRLKALQPQDQWEPPPCATTDYCKPGPAGVEWCYIKQSAGQQGCSEGVKGFCNKPGVTARWQSFAKAAMLGGEIGISELRVVPKWGYNIVKTTLTQDLWIRAAPDFINMTILSQEFIDNMNNTYLQGFEDRGGNSTPSSCQSPCCGLPVLRLPELTASPGPGTLCTLRDMGDLSILEAFYAAKARGLLRLVFRRVDSIGSISQSFKGSQAQDPSTPEDCAARCMLDKRCTSYMVSYNRTSNGPAERGLCISFQENHPYQVYTLDRTTLLDSVAPTLSGTALANARNLFVGPISPFSRLFNSDVDAGVYVSGDGLHAADMLPNGGPHWSAALNLLDCKDLCIKTVDCFAIAYPGCYLLNRTALSIPNQQMEYPSWSSNAGLTQTMVFVKKLVDEKISAVAGADKVFAFKGEGSLLSHAYLNKPGSCAISSTGDVFFTDVWNQRIRKIGGRNVDCLFAVSSGGEDFLAATKLVSQQCTSTPDMETHYERAQAEVVNHRSLTYVENNFCNYVPAVGAGYLQTTNVQVLCALCAEARAASGSAWPQICPPEALCQCTSAMVSVLNQEVYKLCPFQNAYHDKWHVWISSILHCFVQGKADAEYLTNTTLRNSVVQAVIGYNPPASR